MTTSCPTCGASLRGGPRYPLTTLLDMMGYQSVNKAAEALGVSGTTYVRYSCHGVTERTADRLAVRAGFHPAEVWPELTDHQINAASRVCARPNCTTMFVPNRSDQKYCDAPCRRHMAEKRYRERKRATDPEWVASRRAKRRDYYAECGQYERAEHLRRYWDNPEYRQRRIEQERARRKAAA